MSSPLRLRRSINSLLAVIPIAAICATMLLVVATCPLGFDFLDESFYLLSLRAGPSDFSMTSTFFYLRPLYEALQENIAAFRIAGVGILMGSAAIFASAFLKFQTRMLQISSRNRLYRYASFCFILLGAVVYYYPYIRTPSYNLAIAAVSYLFAAALCGMLTAENFRTLRIAAFLTGITIGIAFFIKITTAPVFACIAIAGLILAGRPWKIRLQVILFLLLGGLAWVAVHFGLLQPFSEWFDALRRNFAYLQTINGMHGNDSVWRYMKEMAQLFYRTLRALWPALIPLALGVFPPPVLGRTFPKLPWRAVFLILALLAVVALEIEKKLYGWQFAKLPLLTAYMLWLMVLGTGLLLAWLANRRPTISAPPHDWRSAGMLLLIALIPPAAAFGTGNPLPINIMFAMVPLFAVMLTMAELLGRRLALPLTAPLTMALIACLVSAQIYCGAIHPYGIYSSIFQQTKRVHLGPDNDLRVDAWSRAFIEDLQQTRDRLGIPYGGDILVFFDTPGVAYILGGKSPLTPTYISDNPVAIRALLATLPVERLRRAYILYKQANTVPLAAILPPEIDLAHDFQPAGEVGSFPFGMYDVWVPVTQHTGPADR